VIHIGGCNVKKGGNHGNDNVESKDENDTTNLPNIHICLLIQSTSLQVHGPPTTPHAMVVHRPVQN
jgi:hypothetical protein